MAIRRSLLPTVSTPGIGKGNSLPTITTPNQVLPALKIWQQKLAVTLQKPQLVRPPWNLQASSITGSNSILLGWDAVKGADGYVIYGSSSGDFSSDNQVLKVQRSPVAVSWVDTLPATGITRYYRVASTSGTVADPQSAISSPSAAVKISSGTNGPIYAPPTKTVVINRSNQPRPACFSGNVEIQMADGSYQQLGSLPRDTAFDIKNETGVHSARLIVHEKWTGVMIDFAGNGNWVTFEHLCRPAGGSEKWRPASDFWPNAPRIGVQGITVFNLEVTDARCEADKHFLLRYGIVAHNVKPVND
jgi:hypothetical protein